MPLAKMATVLHRLKPSVRNSVGSLSWMRGFLSLHWHISTPALLSWGLGKFGEIILHSLCFWRFVGIELGGLKGILCPVFSTEPAPTYCSDFRCCFCILAKDLMYFIGLRLRDCKAFPHLCNQTYRGILLPSSILLPLLPAWSEGGGGGRRTVQNWFCKIAHSYPPFLVGKVLAPGLSTLKWKSRRWWLCPLVPVIFL